MINILVVDDEPISADGISIYLEEHGSAEWNILTAYNAMVALKYAQQRIDVLLTDIRMPGMDGFALQEQIKKRWPMVRTVFLTGNGQLDYAQQAIRQGSAVDFVLKMEDETVVLAAVRKAVAALEEDMRIQDALRAAEQAMDRIRPILQKECLDSILKGSFPSGSLCERFNQLGLPLNADTPVLLLAGRLADTSDERTNELVHYALDNILEKFLWPIYRFYTVPETSQGGVVTLIQGDASCAIDVRHVFSLLEIAQQAMGKVMGAVSFVLNYTACPWQDVSRHYRALSLTLEQYADEASDLLILQSDTAALPETVPLQAIYAIRARLEHGEYEQGAALCRELARPKTPSGRIGLYRKLLRLYADVVDSHKDASAIYMARSMPVLHLDPEGWEQTQTEFAQMFRALGKGNQSPVERKEKLVDQICGYVDAHLADDLSLSQIAETTNYSGPYISKLFAEVKGINYNNYVINKRLLRAEELLRNTSAPINEIVVQTGYRSVSYFIHAFRSKYGITPAEFRKMSGRGV